MNFRLHGLLWLVPLSSALLAQAADPLPNLPANRQVLPIESVATAEEGHSFLFNPAGPAFTQPASFEYYQAFAPSQSHAGPGDTGRGLFLSLQSFRFAWQLITTEEGPSRGVLSFGQSRQVLPGLAFGSNLNYTYFLHTDPALAGNLGVNLGLTARPNHHLSMGFVITNLLSPEAPSPEFKTRGTFGLGLRPLGDRLTLAGDISARLASLGTEPSLRLAATALFEPVAGVKLHGSFSVIDAGSAAPEYVLGMGATLHIGTFSIGDQGFLQRSDAGFKPAADAFYVAVHGKRAPTVLKPGGVSGQLWEVTLRDGLEAPPKENMLSSRPDSFPLLFQVRRLREALDNPGVKGVVLKIDEHSGGLADLQEIRALVVKLRERGKPVVGYLYQPTARDIYLASACTRVILHPAGEVRLEPPQRETYYLKGLLDKIGVEAEVVKKGAYKSSPEQFTARAPSLETEEMNRALLEDLYQQLTSGIADGRKLSAAEVTAAFDKLLLTAAEAKDLKLVDDLRYPDELEPVLKEIYGRKYPLHEDNQTEETLVTHWGPQYKIGVVYLGGELQRGSSELPLSLTGQKVISSRETISVLKQMAKDPVVKAVVLRVDSPGGDVFASDEIWHAVKRVQARKPVIVSMSNAAASGGYYLSVPADLLLADPATLTGSIGVFSIKPNAGKLLEKLEVNPHTFTPGTPPAKPFSYDRPWTARERERVAASVENTYQQFLKKVAEGRKMSVAEVDALAGGRVWTGNQAREKHLIDRFGGLDDALTIARERGGLQKTPVVHLEVWPRRTLQDTVVGNLIDDTSEHGFWSRLLGSMGLRIHHEMHKSARLSNRAPDLPDAP